MNTMTKERLEELGYQSKIQSGTRVETPCGRRGIVNFFSYALDKCRVFYGFRKFVEVPISKCRILSVDEAIAV